LTEIYSICLSQKSNLAAQRSSEYQIIPPGNALGMACILDEIFILFDPNFLENTLISFPVVGVFFTKSLHLQQFAGKD